MARIGNVSLPAVDRRGGGFETLSRIGLAAKGVVYVLIGVLALLAAVGDSGETVDTKGALSRISDQPYGEGMMLFIGAGLLAYAFWRTMSAFRDREGQSADIKRFGRRVADLAGGIAHAGLGVVALRLALGGGAGSGSNEAATQTWTARLLDAPYDTLLVVLVGTAIMIGGIWQMAKGWKEKFREDLGSLPAGHDWVIQAGKWGHMARGVVFGIIGSFIVIAALRQNPQEARGLEGALDTLAAQSYGQVLLALVAAGLACYGIYTLVEARYRRL